MHLDARTPPRVLAIPIVQNAWPSPWPHPPPLDLETLCGSGPPVDHRASRESEQVAGMRMGCRPAGGRTHSHTLKDTYGAPTRAGFSLLADPATHSTRHNVEKAVFLLTPSPGPDSKLSKDCAPAAGARVRRYSIAHANLPAHSANLLLVVSVIRSAEAEGIGQGSIGAVGSGWCWWR